MCHYQAKPTLKPLSDTDDWEEFNIVNDKQTNKQMSTCTLKPLSDTEDWVERSFNIVVDVFLIIVITHPYFVNDTTDCKNVYFGEEFDAKLYIFSEEN